MKTISIIVAILLGISISNTQKQNIVCVTDYEYNVDTIYIDTIYKFSMDSTWLYIHKLCRHKLIINHDTVIKLDTVWTKKQ